MERASARDLVVGDDANRLFSTGKYRYRSESASQDEQRKRQWLTLFHLRKSRGEEGRRPA